MAATRGSGLKIAIEPGRVLVGPAGVLLTKVVDVKQFPGAKRFVVVDAGMTELMRPALFQNAYHRVEPLIRRDPPESIVDIVGPICEADCVALLAASAQPVGRCARTDLLLRAALRGRGDCGGETFSGHDQHRLRTPRLEPSVQRDIRRALLSVVNRLCNPEPERRPSEDPVTPAPQPGFTPNNVGNIARTTNIISSIRSAFVTPPAEASRTAVAFAPAPTRSPAEIVGEAVKDPATRAALLRVFEEEMGKAAPTREEMTADIEREVKARIESAAAAPTDGRLSSARSRSVLPPRYRRNA